jgi:hypothetical protein
MPLFRLEPMITMFEWAKTFRVLDRVTTVNDLLGIIGKVKLSLCLTN